MFLDSDVHQILDRFACFDKTKFHVYDRQRFPKRFHYAQHRRSGDVIFDARPGVTFYPLAFYFLMKNCIQNISKVLKTFNVFSAASNDYNFTADHGYDYLAEPMHTIFFARGPNIRSGIQLDAFQNVELFNLFIGLDLC